MTPKPRLSLQRTSAGQNSPLNSPLINRATSQLYPPGSTFKTIVASAALETGEYQTDTKIPAGSSYTLPGTATQLPNDEAQAEGINGQISLQEAVAWSSNTAFAQLGVKLGASKVSDMATKLGFGSTITIDGTESTGTPMTATASTFPSDPTDDKLALASIGQGDTTATPLQMAMVAQAIANNGKLMQPRWSIVCAPPISPYFRRPNRKPWPMRSTRIPQTSSPR